MSWRGPRWAWVLGGLAALLLALWSTGPRRALAALSRVRFAEPIAVADSFLAAAARADTVMLRGLALDTVAPSHMIALFRNEPQLLWAYEQSRHLSSAGRVISRPFVAVDYRVLSRVKDSFCYVPGSTDHLQVTLSPTGKSRKVLHAGLEPCAQSHLGALADSLRMLISHYGSQFIDRIEAEAAISAAVRACLAEVSPDPTFPLPEELWPRLSAAAGVFVGPMAPHMAALYAEMPDLSGLASWDPNPLAPEDIPVLDPDDLRAQARAWVDYHQTFWAWEELNRLYEEEGLDAAWPLVLALIQKADGEALAPLGAGILEDMLRRDGAFVIDRVEAEAAASSRFRFCLSHV